MLLPHPVVQRHILMSFWENQPGSIRRDSATEPLCQLDTPCRWPRGDTLVSPVSPRAWRTLSVSCATSPTACTMRCPRPHSNASRVTGGTLVAQ